MAFGHLWLEYMSRHNFTLTDKCKAHRNKTQKGEREIFLQKYKKSMETEIEIKNMEKGKLGKWNIGKVTKINK